MGTAINLSYTKSRKVKVSIQLMSPASGDGSKENSNTTDLDKVSIQLMSPASGDLF